jgi:hypothetical protein
VDRYYRLRHSRPAFLIVSDDPSTREPRESAGVPADQPDEHTQESQGSPAASAPLPLRGESSRPTRRVVQSVRCRRTIRLDRWMEEPRVD